MFTVDAVYNLVFMGYNYGSKTLSITSTTPLVARILVAMLFDLFVPLPLPVMAGPPPVPLIRLIVVLPPANVVNGELVRSDEKSTASFYMVSEYR